MDPAIIKNENDEENVILKNGWNSRIEDKPSFGSRIAGKGLVRAKRILLLKRTNCYGYEWHESRSRHDQQTYRQTVID